MIEDMAQSVGMVASRRKGEEVGDRVWCDSANEVIYFSTELLGLSPSGLIFVESGKTRLIEFSRIAAIALE